MTADTITIDRISTLEIIALMALDVIRSARVDSKSGDLSPAEAAAEINAAIANLVAANQ